MPILPMPILSLSRGAFGALLLAAATMAAAPATAQKTPVDVELVIAVDVSGSVDPAEARLQRDGYYAALTNHKVVRAIQSGTLGRIGIVYMEWAGNHFQRTVVEWSLIGDGDAAEQFVARLADVPVMTERWTSISGAIDYAMQLFEISPFRGTRRVIDVSGDGTNNNGRSVRVARDEALKTGVVINGLPIVNERPTIWGGSPERNLDLYYEDNVIGGPGSFMIVADGFEKFGDAILTKLIMEIAGTPRGEPTRYAAKMHSLK